MYKRFAYLFYLLGIFQVTNAFGQPVINERFEIEGTPISIFGSVIATDSCYYTAGIHAFLPTLSARQSNFTKFNLDGTINSISVVENDTMGIDLWQGYNLIQTLDDNFAVFAAVKGVSSYSGFCFIKIDPNGDTLITKYHNNFEDGTRLIGINPETILQDVDSTFYGIVGVQRQDDLRGATLFYRLDKFGNLMYHRIYYGISASYYRILKAKSLLKYGDNKFIIASSLYHTFPSPEEERHHTKLIVIDTLGEIIEEHTYWDDLLALDCNSLTKTADGGLLYCGRNGRYDPENEIIGYKARVVKLNADFTEDWEIELGNYTSFAYIGLTNILALNDSEFVAVGFMADFHPLPLHISHLGWLLKFNLDGEIIWERKYSKVPVFEGGFNDPIHELYDVAITPDEGFVMVGQGINYYDDNGELPGQKAWLVKTDKYGCLVPNCQYIGVETEPIDTTDTTDTIIVIPPTPPVTWLFPNPAHEFLFYYHHQENFQPASATIYSTSGQLVQKWEITENDVTYEIDVSQFAAGTYILKVANHLGEIIRTERFAKI